MRRRMTFDEFLKLLPKTMWELGRKGSIREIKGGGCPFVYVVENQKAIELPRIDNQVWADRLRLFDAADNANGHDPKIRRRLLEACGLSE